MSHAIKRRRALRRKLIRFALGGEMEWDRGAAYGFSIAANPSGKPMI
jgi:hypothetical protein